MKLVWNKGLLERKMRKWESVGRREGVRGDKGEKGGECRVMCI